MASAMTVLASEPRGGVFGFVYQIVNGSLKAGSVLNVLTSTLTSLACARVHTRRSRVSRGLGRPWRECRHQLFVLEGNRDDDRRVGICISGVSCVLALPRAPPSAAHTLGRWCRVHAPGDRVDRLDDESRALLRRRAGRGLRVAEQLGHGRRVARHAATIAVE